MQLFDPARRQCAIGSCCRRSELGKVLVIKLVGRLSYPALDGEGGERGIVGRRHEVNHAHVDAQRAALVQFQVVRRHVIDDLDEVIYSCRDDPYLPEAYDPGPSRQ